jgi:riboflavin biosynthesis pyrimidine reductase
MIIDAGGLMEIPEGASRKPRVVVLDRSSRLDNNFGP